MSACNPIHRKTLADDNQFGFTCPVFKANTAIKPCIELRDRFWRGERPEVRRGCQAAMEASKCPIVHVIDQMIIKGNDPYYSATPKLGTLDPDILARVSPVLVRPEIMDKHNISEREREILLKANEDAAKGVKNVTKYAKPRRKPSAPAMATVPETKPDVTVEAAEKGDMTAAINAAGEAQ